MEEKQFITDQRDQFNSVYSYGSRKHVISSNLATRYIVEWRVKVAMHRLMAHGFVSHDSTILTLCSGEGMEGSILCDLGFNNVTVSDLSEQGVHAALQRDSRLNALVLNAQQVHLADGSYDVVLVQDGLHHLPSPVQGFTEMLRLARQGVIFLEPHESLVGRIIGTKWEKNGTAINYVFRWDKTIVEKVASSYLGPNAFQNISFSFWHHNPIYARMTKTLGPKIGLPVVKLIKSSLDFVLGRFGNQFCGLIIKK